MLAATFAPLPASAAPPRLATPQFTSATPNVNSDRQTVSVDFRWVVDAAAHDYHLRVIRNGHVVQHTTSHDGFHRVHTKAFNGTICLGVLSVGQPRGDSALATKCATVSNVTRLPSPSFLNPGAIEASNGNSVTFKWRKVQEAHAYHTRVRLDGRIVDHSEAQQATNPSFVVNTAGFSGTVCLDVLAVGQPWGDSARSSHCITTGAETIVRQVAIEQEIARLVNELRANPTGRLARQGAAPSCLTDSFYDIQLDSSGRPRAASALTYNTTVARDLSYDWSEHMAETGNLVHRSNDETVQIYTNLGISLRAWGENIARGSFGGSADAIALSMFSLWRESSTGHYCSMIAPVFTNFGVGVAKTSNGMYFGTQNFYSTQ